MSAVKPIPPNDFCRKLYRFDRDFRVTWDEGMGVWQIWCEDHRTKNLSHVMNVMNEDSSYRPLDDRVFPILIRNRWYAEHPEEVQKDFVDTFVDKAEKDRKDIDDNLKYIGKDPSLKRSFEKVREKAGFVDKNEWTTPRTLYDVYGRPLTNAEGEEVKYVPHESLTE